MWLRWLTTFSDRFLHAFGGGCGGCSLLSTKGFFLKTDSDINRRKKAIGWVLLRFP